MQKVFLPHARPPSLVGDSTRKPRLPWSPSAEVCALFLAGSTLRFSVQGGLGCYLRDLCYMGSSHQDVKLVSESY
jgi:hypothetical protein